MGRYELILFDLDGTLIDSVDDITVLVNRAMRELGEKEHTRDVIGGFIGNGAENLIACSLPGGREHPGFGEALRIFREGYLQQDARDTKIFDGIYDVLDRLSDEGYKLAVISNKFRAASEEIVKACFDGYFDLTLGESPEMARKPAPDMVVCALKQLDCERGRAVLIGDSEVDIKTAENAGIDCISATWGLRTEQCLRENGAQTVIHRPQDILQAIESA